MSDDDLDPVFTGAMDTLMEVEATRRDAIGRLGFRQRAQAVAQFEKTASDMRRTEAIEAAEMAARGVERRPVADYEVEQRAAIEECEDLYGRRLLLLEEAEAWGRMMLQHLFVDLFECIDAAFRPCVTRVYSHAWGTYVSKVLPVKPHALDRLGKNNERHLPDFMWAAKTPKSDSVHPHSKIESTTQHLKIKS